MEHRLTTEFEFFDFRSFHIPHATNLTNLHEFSSHFSNCTFVAIRVIRGRMVELLDEGFEFSLESNCIRYVLWVEPILIAAPVRLSSNWREVDGDSFLPARFARNLNSRVFFSHAQSNDEGFRLRTVRLRLPGTASAVKSDYSGD